MSVVLGKLLQASDSVAELRALFGVDPPWWYPFRQPSPLIRHIQPLQEVAVVIAAQQREIASTSLNVPRQ